MVLLGSPNLTKQSPDLERTLAHATYLKPGAQDPQYVGHEFL
ncbi:MAG: hypothetical protein Ct9H300mP15_08050 [Gemmatimonadota bacterium]|nr:MAG: hypothetical protein Ct9H300mP15_08050 [Gemmatimonadota bacterium]